MKILMTRRLLEGDKKYINDGLSACIGDSFKLVEPKTFDENGICREIKDTEILLGPYITKRILEEADNLKLIQVPWTGMDTFDFEAVSGSTVPICNSHSNSLMVAEFCIALVLDLIKKISYHDRKLRSGNWNRDQTPLDLKSGTLFNKTVCILGYGRIGRQIGKLLSSFGAKVIAVANHGGDYPEVLGLYEGLSWIKAVKQADICICALPLTPQTRGQIDAGAISEMKEGCLLVNISRAEIIIEDDLYAALQQGSLAGFASDVWWNTPERGESVSFVSTHNRFEELDNVILSPHRAGFVEGALAHLDDAITNMANLAQGKPLINLVDISAGY